MNRLAQACLLVAVPLAALCLVVACGYDEKPDVVYPCPTTGGGYPTPPPTGGPGTSDFTPVASVLAARCAACHGGAPFLTTGPAFKAKAQGRVARGEMPPAGSAQAQALTPQEKSILTSF